MRLETGHVDLELTNRMKPDRGAPGHRRGGGVAEEDMPTKLFVKMRLDLDLSLGSLLKHPMFEEAESEFQQLASFTTGFKLRNALEVRGGAGVGGGRREAGGCGAGRGGAGGGGAGGHPMFEEAESEFQQLASFTTGFKLRNALEVRGAGGGGRWGGRRGDVGRGEVGRGAGQGDTRCLRRRRASSSNSPRSQPASSCATHSR